MDAGVIEPLRKISTGHAVTALVRAEPEPLRDHRASPVGWWESIQMIPGPRVVVVHDLDDPRGQGAQWGKFTAERLKALSRDVRPGTC